MKIIKGNLVHIIIIVLWIIFILPVVIIAIGMGGGFTTFSDLNDMIGSEGYLYALFYFSRIWIMTLFPIIYIFGVISLRKSRKRK